MSRFYFFPWGLFLRFCRAGSSLVCLGSLLLRSMSSGYTDRLWEVWCRGWLLWGTWILPDRGWNPVPGIAWWILNHGPPGKSSVSISISLPCTELPWASTQLSWFWRYWLSVGTPGDYTSFPGRIITNCVGGGWGRKVLQCGLRITRSLGRDSSKLARLLLHFLGDLRKPRQPVWKSSRPGEQQFWIPEVINRIEQRGDLRIRGGAGVSLFWKMWSALAGWENKNRSN